MSLGGVWCMVINELNLRLLAVRAFGPPRHTLPGSIYAPCSLHVALSPSMQYNLTAANVLRRLGIGNGSGATICYTGSRLMVDDQPRNRLRSLRNACAPTDLAYLISEGGGFGHQRMGQIRFHGRVSQKPMPVLLHLLHGAASRFEKCMQ